MTARFHSRSRAAAQDRMAHGQARQVWARLLAAAVTEAASAGAKPLESATFSGLLTTTARVPFPLAYGAAQSAAEAFIAVARRVVETPDPALRRPLAAFMAAGAACLDQLLAQAAHEAAGVTRRQMGEREED